jgi:RNA polymerase sigma factor (sigma-70 family)
MITTLFPDLFAEPLNDLTTGERNALVLSCERLCASLARQACVGVPGIDADDLTQEALLVCTEASVKWSPRLSVKFSSYATTGIKRHLGKLVSAHRSRGTVQVESWDDVPTARPGDDDEPANAEEFTAEQAEAVARLIEPMRTVVRLVLEDGLPPDRIAAQLGSTTKDVKLMLRNAAAQLRRDLASMSRPALFDFCGVSEEEAA